MVNLRLFTQIQYRIFLNAVPHRFSEIGTILILIHSLLAFTGAPLLILIYNAVGSEDILFLKTIGMTGIVLGILNVLAIIFSLKMAKIIGQGLFLIVYTTGSLFSTNEHFIFDLSTFFNLKNFINPFFWLIVFFPQSGYFMVCLVAISFFSSITKKKGNFCYQCLTAQKMSDKFCEICGDLLLPCYMSEKASKKIL